MVNTAVAFEDRSRYAWGRIGRPFPAGCALPAKPPLRCRTPEQFKAWSQNLGHEQVLTTLVSYGEVACQRQGEIMQELAIDKSMENSQANDVAEILLKKLQEAGVSLRD